MVVCVWEGVRGREGGGGGKGVRGGVEWGGVGWSGVVVVVVVVVVVFVKCWKGPCWGKDVEFSGSLGRWGIAHDSQHLECPEEVWAAWRALLLSWKERTGPPRRDGGPWALPPSGDIESVCCVRFAHDVRRKYLWVKW